MFLFPVDKGPNMMEHESVNLLLLLLLLLARVVHPDSYWTEDYDQGTVILGCTVQLGWVKYS